MYLKNLGKAVVRPVRPLVAGSFCALRYIYTAGHPVDDSGYIKIVFRSAGDFGTPQFTDPRKENYCSIRTSGRCRIEPRFDPKGHTRPWGLALYLKITGGFLDRGDTVTVLFGDRSKGSPGWRMQTFCARSFEFKTLVDPIATYEFKELSRSPGLRVVPGKPVRAVLIAPSTVTVGRPFRAALKLEDRFGNPVALPRRFTHSGFTEPGLARVEARDPRTGLRATSNPIRVTKAVPAFIPCWADLHGQSGETIGTNSIRDYFTFARDYALLDAAAHQGNDFQVTDEFWSEINRTTRAFYRPGRFVTFPGYEWSGNTPLGGDRNIYFEREGGPIYRSSRDLLPGGISRFPDAPTARDLFRRLKKGRGPAAFGFAHVGGRYPDMDTHDPGIELAVEIHSAWGTFEWLADDAFRRGLRVGLCANSDDHKGRPGASHPGCGKFGSYGGLTCVLTRSLDRAGLLEALRARRFFATTGHRPHLDVRLDPGDGHEVLMGAAVRWLGPSARLKAGVMGTAPLEYAEVINGTRRIARMWAYEEDPESPRIKIWWSGAEVRGRARLSRWDGFLKVKGNAIREVTAVNFWNAHHPVRQTGGDRVDWKSATTGGGAGIILTLAEPRSGVLEIETVQGRMRCALSAIGRDPVSRDFGGLRKRVEVYRLPAKGRDGLFEFALPVNKLRQGDNPVYVKTVQEDGHMAWSSPVYLSVD